MPTAEFLQLIVVAIVAGAVSYTTRPVYTTLYAGLSGKDAAQIVDKLRDQKIPFEVSADGGTSWQEVASWDDSSNGWRTEEVATPQLDGAAQARIRFRLTSDVSVTADGWHVDDIVVRGAAPVPGGFVFGDGFESGDSSAWSTAQP